MNADRLPLDLLNQLRELSTCVVASAIETFTVRMRNTGFADSSIRCMFPELPRMVGYAATARIRSAEPPMEGRSYYYRDDWWKNIQTIPEPRIVVIQDVDEHPGLGAFVGEVHANILLALGCEGLVTNGAVRDLMPVKAAGFKLFAGDISVSHAYAHIFDFGGNVEVGGLNIKPGDLIHGDLHGVQTIPLDIVARVPSVAHDILLKRKRLIAQCRSDGFRVERLQEALKEIEKG